MIDLKKLLEAGVHFGHKTSRWSPKMRPYIWGAKNKVHLIDVSKTAILLDRAGGFLQEAASTGGKFLFLGTKKPAQSIMQRVATSLQMPFVIHRWVGGTLSNYDQVKKAVTRLLHMRDILQKATTHYKKKEISMIQKEAARLEKNVGGIIDFEYPPAAIIIVDVKKEQAAVKEASRLGIPVVALVDTNTNPDGVTFIIPSNDDSPKAIACIVDYLGDRIKAGAKEYENNKAKLKAEQEEKRAAAKAEKTSVKVEKVEKIEPVTASSSETKEPVKKTSKTETETKPKSVKKAESKKEDA